jgi:hypothetical protein
VLTQGNGEVVSGVLISAARLAEGGEEGGYVRGRLHRVGECEPDRSAVQAACTNLRGGIVFGELEGS